MKYKTFLFKKNKIIKNPVIFSKTFLINIIQTLILFSKKTSNNKNF